MRKTVGIIKEYVPVFTLASASVALVSLVLALASGSSYAVADGINSTVSAAYRFVMASITSILPFSLFEILMYLVLPLAMFLVFAAFRFCKTNRARIRYALSLLGVVLLIYSGYALALTVAYNVTPLAERLDAPEVEITEDNLYDTALELLTEANALAERISYGEDGVSEMPYSLDELSAKLCDAYASLSEKHDFIDSYSSRVKPILTEGAMSSLQLLGIYTYYTGEANVNIHYPDFNLPFTAAHELAHQRGIARENEANFVAFLVCLESDDDFIRYSGYIRLYEYVASSLYMTNRERYFELIENMSDSVRSDLIADSETTERYSDTWLANLSTALNDMFLKMNGTEGVISYGLVTRLAVAYYSAE